MEKGTIRIRFRHDIPTFLQQNISIIDETIFIIGENGSMRAKVGALIGYERSDRTGTGWTCYQFVEDSEEASSK